jgi:hypothetical protein
MPARRVRCLIASAAAVAACALLPAAASAHPEACAETTFSTSLISPFEDVNAASEGCMSDAAISGIDDSAAQLAAGESAGTSNLRLLSNTPKAAPFESTADLNSDIAFEDGYAFQGNYDGIQVWDVRKGDSPKLVGALHCPGSQNDVTVNDGIMVTSTDSRRNKAECEGNRPATGAESGSEATSWEGVRVFDVSDPANPRYLTAVRTDCGSHTHTVLPEDDRLLIYVSSYDSGAGRVNCEGAHDKISIVEVPLDDPASAAVLSEPNLFPNGGNPGDADTRATNGCHDITVYQDLDLAAGACMGEGVMMDISDPENPEVLSNIYDNENFAFWHSATISNDGKKALFTDELGGGSDPTCNDTVGPNKGADAIYDITDPANPKFLSYYKIPRTQSNSENCVAHNGNLIPNNKGRDILVQSWYQGGVSIIDWTDGSNVKELAWFDRGPYGPTLPPLAGFWSSYFYNGYIYGSEIQRGWDVFKFNDSSVAGSRAYKSGTLNAQTQFPHGKPGNGPKS